MTRKQQRPIKAHSRTTGKIILIALGLFVVGSVTLVYLANEENKKNEIDVRRFLDLSCDDMVKELDGEEWKTQALSNKIQAGDCNN